METILIMSAIMLAIMLYSTFVIAKQQRTIDRLTDKLMARDYKEYKSMTKPLMEDEKPRRKPMSFYDDPNIEDEIQ